MHRRIAFRSLLAFTSLVLFVWSCTKIDTTTIGSDLIPEVDNINTFADTLDIITTQGVFSGAFKDTTRLNLTEEYALGKVNDPLMGGTQANLYLQMKPPFYPYYIGKAAKDTILQADSVVLCFSYKASWGDSTVPLQLQVFRVSEDARDYWDTLFQEIKGFPFLYLQDINFAPLIEEALSPVTTVDIRTIGNWVKVGKSDSVNNQIRIKLSDQFRDLLFSRDSSSVITSNKGFLADSLFRQFNNGFAVLASNGNSLAYLNLIEDKTRLELHYKKTNGGIRDTVYSNFFFNSTLKGETIRRSVVANNITRTHSFLPTGDQELYLQTTPGTFANLYIPELSTLSNRIIHRAELQIEQIPDPINDKIFTESQYLYLDLVDTGSVRKYKSIYFDLNPGTLYDPDFISKVIPYFPSNGEVAFNYFGGFLRKKITPSGTRSYYNINMTRHVQQIVTKKTPNYQFRLFPAHSFSYSQYKRENEQVVQIPYRNPIAYGRVRVGGGSNPNPEYRMKLRIIYSNIK